jgi:hypothetical protein
MLTPSHISLREHHYRRRARQRLSGETPAPARASDTYYRSAASLWRESPERALQCDAHPLTSRAPLQSERRPLLLPEHNRRAACERVSHPSASPGVGHSPAAPAGCAPQSPRWYSCMAVQCTRYAGACLLAACIVCLPGARPPDLGVGWGSCSFGSRRCPRGPRQDAPALALGNEPGQRRAERGHTSHFRVQAPATAWVRRVCSLC